MGRSKRLALFFGVASLPVLAACNAIVGISDFKRTECGANPCPSEEAGIDQFVPDNFVPDSGKDSGTDAPPGVGPVSWAAWQMPNHDKDAGILIGDPRPLKYNIIDADQVEDDWTKLVWRRAVVGTAAPGTDLSYSAARVECQKIKDGATWRLPKRIELVTLMSHGLGKPFINRTAFPGVFSDAVWTSSEVRPFAGKYWAVDFETGALTQLDGNDNTEFAKVLCVKDKQ